MTCTFMTRILSASGGRSSSAVVLGRRACWARAFLPVCAMVVVGCVDRETPSETQPGTGSGEASSGGDTTGASVATSVGTTTEASTSTSAVDESSSGDPTDPPPDGGLGPWGFGYVETEIRGHWMSFDDFDGDGIIDVFANGPEQAVTYLGDGSGGFTEAASRPALSPYFISRTGDFDGDGDVDVAAFDSYSDDSFPLLLNDGAGSFASPQQVPVEGFYGFGVVPLRYDDDEDDDLFVPQGHSGGGWIAEALGDGSFAVGPMVPQPACYFSGTAAADLDGDGFDEVVGTGSCNAIPGVLPLVVYGRAGGTFDVLQIVTGDLGPVHEGCDVALLDVDGDGEHDVVTGTDGGLYVVGGVGGGVLADPPVVLTHTYPGYMRRVIPLHVDGTVGFVLESYEDREVSAAALVVPDPGWSSLQTHLLELQGRVAGAADFDGDGSPDLAVLVGDEPATLGIWLSGG